MRQMTLPPPPPPILRPVLMVLMLGLIWVRVGLFPSYEQENRLEQHGQKQQRQEEWQKQKSDRNVLLEPFSRPPSILSEEFNFPDALMGSLDNSSISHRHEENYNINSSSSYPFKHSSLFASPVRNASQREMNVNPTHLPPKKSSSFSPVLSLHHPVEQGVAVHPSSSGGMVSLFESPVILEPLWKCHENQRKKNNYDNENEKKKKLVFVHVFKTAGSTLRSFFANYSRRCHLGWALVVSCTGVSAESTRDSGGRNMMVNGNENVTFWKNANYNRNARRRGGKCVLKKGVKRDGSSFHTNEKSSGVNNTFLSQHIDILGGHLKLGSADYAWGSSYDGGNRVVGHFEFNQNLRRSNARFSMVPSMSRPSPSASNIRHLAFFRNAVDKYVSGAAFSLRKTLKKAKQRGERARPPTLEDIVYKIKRDVQTARDQGHYKENYSGYLITPSQVEENRSSGVKLSVEERTNLTMQNLVERNVVVGIVERMSQSLELLSHLLDPEDHLIDLFVEYGMRRSDNNESEHEDKRNRRLSSSMSPHPGPKRSNKSRIPTSEIVSELRRDEAFFNVLEEYVKYEQRIADFAVGLHVRQYNALKKWQEAKTVTFE